MLVGSIVETYNKETECKKGNECGYFQFGGSTVVLLFKPETIQILPQFIQNSLQGFETEVKMGAPVALAPAAGRRDQERQRRERDSGGGAPGEYGSPSGSDRRAIDPQTSLLSSSPPSFIRRAGLL